MPLVRVRVVGPAAPHRRLLTDAPRGCARQAALPAARYGRGPRHPWNGLTVVSTFAGAGGSSTGYRIAGYRVLAAVEFVPAAADSYEANKADYTTLLRRDVRNVTAGELLDACGLSAGELDVLDGSPPCEPFSTAGQRDRTWNEIREYSGQRQRTDDLFYEYARLVDDVRPRVFVAENVTGFARGRARGYFKRILAALRDCGYQVQARTLDASWLGVPQTRQRVIIMGVREDLGVAPVFPAPLPYRCLVRDALGDVELLLQGSEPRFTRRVTSDQPAPTVAAVGIGAVWASACRILNGGESRKLTIPDLRRLCGFPDDYVLAGTFAQQWERLGDAVPPPMAAAIASATADGPLGGAGGF